MERLDSRGRGEQLERKALKGYTRVGVVCRISSARRVAMPITFAHAPPNEASLQALAHLRVAVFREWPYLYHGNAGSETAYLRTYQETPHAWLTLAYDDDLLVGASTGVPLSAEAREVSRDFDAEEIPRTFYGGETMLVPSHRGRGLYRIFLERREEYARDAGFKALVFCGVERDPGDPRRPQGHRDIEDVWRHLGYSPYGKRYACMRWREIGDDEESEHRLRFWRRPLRDAT